MQRKRATDKKFPVIAGKKFGHFLVNGKWIEAKAKFATENMVCQLCWRDILPSDRIFALTAMKNLAGEKTARAAHYGCAKREFEKQMRKKKKFDLSPRAKMFVDVISGAHHAPIVTKRSQPEAARAT